MTTIDWFFLGLLSGFLLAIATCVFVMGSELLRSLGRGDDA